MRRFESAKDTWIQAMLLVSGAGCATLAVYFWLRFDAFGIATVLGLVLAGTAGVMFWILAGTWYGLDPRGLVVRSGPYRTFIPYGDIRGVAPTTSMLASPALSLRRLYIEYSGHPMGVRVSPDDPDGFITELATRCPHLVRDGYTLGAKHGQ